MDMDFVTEVATDLGVYFFTVLDAISAWHPTGCGHSFAREVTLSVVAVRSSIHRRRVRADHKSHLLARSETTRIGSSLRSSKTRNKVC